MYSSFYTAGAGVRAQQSKMDVVSNNIANVNTTGYKTKNAVFSDLMYVDHQDAQAGHLQVGKGVKLSATRTVLQKEGGLQQTGNSLDFAIQGDGFFALSDLNGENTVYTRDGRFMISSLDETMYLTNSSGLLVLNSEGDPIEMDELDINADLADLDIGVYTIPVRDGMVEDGYNNYRLIDRNGEPEAIEGAQLHRGYLETSNVDVAREFSQIIETQRAYSMTLKMVQTSDEIEQDINSLRR